MKTINSFRSKFFALVLALVASVSSFAKDGYPDFQVDGLYYNFLEGDSVQVTYRQRPVLPTGDSTATPKKNSEGLGYENFTEVVIPSMITYEDKTYHVTRIGHGTFWWCDKLTYVDIPNTIKSIGIAAFRSCRTLASITLNEGLESIEHHAFYDCVRLKEVTLPSTLKTMGQSIFAFSTDLEKVTCKAIVPPTVEKDVLTDINNYNAAIIANATLYVPAQSLITYQNTYPWNTFGQILPIEDSFKDLFPTLWGLERTDVEGTTMGYDDPYHMSFSKYTPTLVDGIWYLFDGRNYFREANNQIIWYAPYLNTVDAVLYDWTLQVGDTLPIYSNPFHKDNNRGSLFRVTDVSTITLLDGKEYKKWTFSGGFEVVEGIGAINKGFGHYYCLLHTTHPAVYTGWKPICISKNGQLLYQMDEIKMISNELKCMCELTPSYKDQWCNTWNTIDFDGMRFEETAETWQYKLANDTIINNQKYTIVNRYWTADRNNTKQYVAAVRFTDDRKVYIYYDNAEYLLYDFNVQEGDELEVFVGINNYTSEIKTYKCTVTGVEQYACVGCPAAITLEVHNHPNDFREFYRQTQWIEGVGDINGFLNGINHYVEVDGGYTYCLLCAYHDEEQVYTTDNEKLASYNCEYNAGYEYSFPTLAGLQRTMCREYIGYEGRNETWMTETEKEVLINDKFYRKWDKWLLREENDRIYVYSNKQDILLYDFTLEVGDSLRTLILHPDLGIIDVPIGTIYPIDTLIVTNISTVTLLDGKEYRKWSFNNGEFEYVKGIGCLDGNFLALAKDVVNGDYINSHLVCVSKNGQLLYQMDEAEMERLGAECLCEVETSYKSQWCNKWNVMWFDGMRFDETARTSKYRLGKDTVIGDYTYSKFIPGTYVRFTDDRKVYVYHEYFDDHDPYSEDLPTGEYLAYDFSAKVGDTLEVFSGIHSYTTEQCVVYDVQTDPETNLRTIMLHPLRVVDSDGHIGVSDEEITWLEGVGSPNGFLISTPLPGGGSYVLLCAYKDDELKYTGSFYERFGCDYKAGVVSDDLFPTLSGLQRTICREYCEQADNKTRIEQFTNLTTRTETGGSYLYYSPFLLREKDNKILIYSRTLNKDLVLYDFNLQVGDSLPMLYIDFFAKDDWIADRDMEIWCVVDYHKDLEGNILPADTLIVTDVSAITLLDGKEYKKWTFNNGMEYVEGIGSFGNGQWSGDFFQLIANRDVPTSLQGEHLVCVSKNNQLLYQMDDTEMEQLETECLCEYNAEQKPEDLFPTLWGLQRTHTIEMYDHAPNDGKRSGGYPLPFASVKDTVINGKTYLQFGDYVNGSNYSLFFLREENNKVLIYSSILQEDLVLYDYTLKLGDSLPAITSDHDYFSDHHFTKLDKAENIFTYVVTDVSTITLLDGIERKKWILQNKYLPIIEYVEGIGCYGENTSDSGDFFRLIHDHPYTTEYVGDHLVCVSKNGQLLYSMPQEEMNSFTLTCECLSQEDTIDPEDLFPTLWGLQRTSLTVKMSPTLFSAKTEVRYIKNKAYLDFHGYFLREENNQVLVYSGLQEEDLVLYDYSLEVGDTLTTLNYDYSIEGVPLTDLVVDYPIPDPYGSYDPIDTLIVTNILYVTLLDGKEYKQWTFNNGMQYVEGIGQFGQSIWAGDFFALIRKPNGFTWPDTRDYLVCASRNGQLLYQMDDAEMERLGAECLCDYNSGPKKDNAKNGKIGGRPTPTQWNMLEFETKEVDGTPTITRAETFSYTLENDSIVAKGKTFYQLARQSTKDTAITKSFVGALHFGEDEDNRVYFLRDGVEYVLYDFTAEPGDTIEIFAGINNYPQYTTYTHVVTGKDTLENGACRMMLEVVFPDETSSVENAQKVWLAGLGSIDGIVHNVATRATKARSSETQTSVMLCAWRDDDCLYTTDHPEYDTFGCIYNQDPTAVESPTSPSSYQKFLREGQLLIMHNGKTYTVMGIEMK